ncbi:MAG: hypothetical protein PHS46_08070 [Candidatus Omnitrophica bacterium]|nr:hypothetical protein [Candidatus Omnitrophota bacterium]
MMKKGIPIESCEQCKFRLSGLKDGTEVFSCSVIRGNLGQKDMTLKEWIKIDDKHKEAFTAFTMKGETEFFPDCPFPDWGA